MEKQVKTTHINTQYSKINDYIKICLNQDLHDETNHMDKYPIKDKNNIERKRFTFNRLNQDAIKQQDEEDDFQKVDYQEMIKLKNLVKSYREENLRLVQQSTENMELFNSYMEETEKRISCKNEEIQSLKNRIKDLQEKYRKCESQLKKAQQRLQNEFSLKNTIKIQNRQKRSSIQLNNKIQNIPPKIPKNQNRKDQQTRVFEKQNTQKYKQAKLLKQSYRSLARSFQKQIQLRKASQDYDQARNNYYRTVNNSPRPSFKCKNRTIISDPLQQQSNTRNTLNALISPRTICTNLSFFEPNQRLSNFKNLDRLANNQRIVSQSIFLNEQNTLQFDKIDLRKNIKHFRRP